MEQHSLLHLRQQKPHSSSLTRSLHGLFLVLSFLHCIKIDVGDFCKQKTAFLNLRFKNGTPMLNKRYHLVQLMYARLQDRPVGHHITPGKLTLVPCEVDPREVVGRI